MRVNREGKLEIDADTLVEKLAGSIDDVTALFSGVDSFADQLRRAADRFVDPLNDQGMLVARIAGTNESIADIDESIAAAEERLETLEANLIREFAALEQTLSRIRSQGDFLGQFLLASRSR